jgi:hypothetical protein
MQATSLCRLKTRRCARTRPPQYTLYHTTSVGQPLATTGQQAALGSKPQKGMQSRPFYGTSGRTQLCGYARRQRFIPFPWCVLGR